MINIEMNTDFMNLVATIIKTGGTPFLVGEPGIGKSSIVRSMCDKEGWKFFEILCNQLGDKSDLTGVRTVQEDMEINGTVVKEWVQKFFPHYVLMKARTYCLEHPDEDVIVLLDEINRTTSDTTSAILSLITARTIGSYDIPNNLSFVVAGNDKGNVTVLDTASISRFVKIKIKPSAKAYMDWEQNLNPYIKKVLTSHPDYIFCKGNQIVSSTVTGDDGDEYMSEYEAFDEAAEGFEQITTPRTIAGLNAFLNACSQDTLNYYVGQICKDDQTGEDVSLLQTIVSGYVGETVFATAVCAAIADDIANGLMQKANTIVKPTKPSIYNGILRCKDRQTRDDMIANMSDEERSSIIVYAVWEKGVNNADLIESLARSFTGQFLTGDYQPQFSALKSHDELDADNYAALINSNTSLGLVMKSILGE